MIAVAPIAITQAMIVATNAVDLAAWVIGTTYALGAQISYLGRNWTSLQAANTGNTPGAAPLWWVDAGPSNQMAAFDTSVLTATTRTSGLAFTLAVGRFTTLGLMGLQGQSVTITISDGHGGAVIFTDTRVLAISDGTYFGFCFEDWAQAQESVWSALPSTPDAEVTITITGSGTTACGLCVLGTGFDAGQVTVDMSTPIEDRGRFSLDALGNAVVLERGYSKSLICTLKNTRANYARVMDFFRANIGAYLLIIPAPEQGDLDVAITFGRYVKFVPVIPGATHISANLEVAGTR